MPNVFAIISWGARRLRTTEKAMSSKSLESLRPTETLEIENGLTLVPRVKINLTVFPSETSSVTKPIDEWQLKRALVDFLKTSFHVPITVPEEDIHVKRFKDLKKRKRVDPVAGGSIFIRDLGFVIGKSEDDLEVVEKKFLDWRRSLVEKMDGIELNLEGLKFRLGAAIPVTDDFPGMRKDWEDFYAFRNRGYSRGGSGKQQPDTIVLRGAPSRWFAEPRVSSKPSMLVTHTIFSTFGKIRNLSVAEDNDLDDKADGDDGDIVSGLHCKIVVQFERYRDFYNALKVLCGRSLQKQGSRLRADYEVTWDRDGFFQNSRGHAPESSGRMPEIAAAGYKSGAGAPRRQMFFPHSSYDSSRPKRFKE